MRVDHSYKNDCKNKIEYLIRKFELDMWISTYTETTALCKFDLVIGKTKIQQVMNLENEFQNILGRKTVLGYNNGYLNVILPKRHQDKLPLFDILNSRFYEECPGKLKIALGEDVEGALMVGDLESWVHLLIGGEPGSGKSIFLHAIINSLIYNCDDTELKLVLIDTKEVELGLYENIPYLLKPVATNVKTAELTMKWLIKEMNDRKRTIRSAGCRDIKSYNRKSGNQLPHIVVVIDEYANLVLRNKKIEEDVIDLAQMARFCGIHLVIATQKPSADIISSDLKANIPTRIAFSVASHYDSKTILDVTGAEKLNKKGDMLLKDEDGVQRIQGAYIGEEEIEEIVDNMRVYEQPEFYHEQNCKEEYVDYEILDKDGQVLMLGYEEVDEEYKQFYKAALECIKQGKCNHWMLKQTFRIGNGTADSLLETLQQKEIISSEKVGHHYEILISLDEFKNKFKEV
jgi:DNA segregation ATPase FtsK/SpoIIIE, S-DNA-T family